MATKRPLIPHPDNPLWMLVPLAKGKGFAVVDIQDAEEAGRHDWRLEKARKCRVSYASTAIRRENGTWVTVRLHRMIAALAGFGDCPEVDHQNGDGLDNRRSNLRPATKAQNTRNTRLHRDNRSGAKGVSWDKRRGKWQARIMADGKRFALGYYPDIHAARAAVIAARDRLHGAFARAA